MTTIPKKSWVEPQEAHVRASQRMSYHGEDTKKFFQKLLENPLTKPPKCGTINTKEGKENPTNQKGKRNEESHHEHHPVSDRHHRHP